MVAFLLRLGHYILLESIPEGELNMSEDQDDKTTTRHLMYTFAAFAVLGVLLIIGANIIG